MTRSVRMFVAVMLIATVLPAAWQATSPGSVFARQQDATRIEVVPNRYIAVLADAQFTSSASTAARFDRMAGADVDQVYDTVFAGFAGTFSPDAVRAMMQDPAIAEVHPDVTATVQGQSLQPGINRVDADLNPTRAGDGSGTIDVDVAVIDTGVGPHSDLTIAGGFDCLYMGSLRDYYGHGTHVAGIIAAKDNDFGVVGVAPGARIWSVRVLDQYGNGSLSSVICGMNWVANHAATIEVANMSLGLIVDDYGSGCTSSPTHRAICAMTNAGVTVMAAACNAGIDASTCSPGRYPEVVSVSAFADWDGKPGGLAGCKTTPDGFYGCDDRRASFSNYGATVDIAAVGVGVYSTIFDNRYGYWSGTSMATPHVTGAAALIIAQQGKMSPSKVRERLLLTAQSGPVPGDFDAYAEPIVNVASLGVGTIDAPSSAKPVEKIRIRVSDVLPNTTATFRFNGGVIGSFVVTSNGNAYLTWQVPEIAYGKYEIKVTNQRKTITKQILVRPSLVLSEREGQPGDTILATLDGFSANSSTVLSMDTGGGTRTLARPTTNGQGSAEVTIAIPPSSSGLHRVTATDGSGVSTYLTVRTLPVVFAPDSVAAGEWLPVQLLGFVAGETVELRWGSATGEMLRTKIVNTSGSGNVNAKIPIASSNGKHSLWAIGDQGARVRITVSTFGATEEPTPIPTETVVVPTETIEVSPTVAETNTVTPEPATETPHETSTSTPLPTDTVVTEATVFPVPTSTPGLEGTASE